ncbi:hypothetical protein KY321_00855 [Candidatus Woesearchaeota archaeon]|nr:hypothetical protein [Candidatus Woesearchaeota archaeon]
MKFNKILIYLIIAMTLVVLVNSNPSKVNILKINYNEGNINFIEKTSKFGYAPDRVIQPEVGHNLTIYSNIEELHSFKFKIPNLEFVDGYYEEQNLGEIVKLENINFSLIVPSYINEEELIIYDENNVIKEKVTLVEKKSTRKDNYFLTFILTTTLLLIILIIIKIKK